MEQQPTKAYLKAKKKVETLRGFYSHVSVYIIINTLLICMSANLFNSSPIDFLAIGNYVTAFFWGIGLVSHGLYVLYVYYAEQNIFQKWEDKKIEQILKEDEDEFARSKRWE